MHWPRSDRFRRLVGSALLLSACTSERSSLPLQVVAAKDRVSSAIIDDTSTWNAYAMDVQIQNIRADNSGKMVPLQSPPIKYHIARVATASGQVRTLVDLDNPALGVLAPGSTRAFPARLRRLQLEDRGDGSEPIIRDAEGSVMKIKGAARAIARSGTNPASDRLLGQLSAQARLRPGSSAPGGGRATTLAELNEFVISGQKREERLTRLTSQFGAPQLSKDGKHVYHGRQGSLKHTVYADPQNSVVIGMDEHKAERLTRRLRWSFEPNQQGELVRTKMRTEEYRADGKLARSMEVSYANITLERRAP